MDLVHNERTKLTATYLNGCAIAIFAVASLAPLFTSVYGQTGNGATPPLTFVITIGAGCLLGSAILHWIARRLLGSLQ